MGVAINEPWLDFQRLWAEFSESRQYLKNVTSATLKFYGSTWKCFGPSLCSVRIHADNADAAQRREQESSLVKAVRRCIIERRQNEELAASSINTYLTALNAFLKWAYDERYLAERHIIEDLLVEKKFPEILSADQVKLFVRYVPKSRSQHRAHTMGVVMLDSGIRIDEALSLKYGDVRLTESILNIRTGKGRKQRFVPLSHMGVRHLFKYLKTFPGQPGEYLFGTSAGTKMLPRNAQRDLWVVERHAGIPESGWHKFRHTFGSNYIRNGGNSVTLQKILGHSDPTTTLLYVHMQTEDIKARHEDFSALRSAYE